ncbi:D-2-hydroxyglutaric acid dehydrogenase isoform X2 [Lycorma delicatula]|uniref:D-2-hydroxyglutaric acid dehydrogenase isoform X2 n=1 Tax=Lycorma delicatula TaxID=130591 RepID=UPI003F512D2D
MKKILSVTQFLLNGLRKHENIRCLHTGYISHQKQFVLTKDRYPHIKRGNYTELNDNHVKFFKDLLGSDRVLTDPNDVQPYNTDWIKMVCGTLVCEAGCVLETLDQELEKHNLMMPLDLGAKGSCQIGGNISTNAGGLRFLRYGSLQGNVLGVEVVLANGEVLDCLNVLKKDNTGFHLRHLFIGSEGTLGIVTKAALQCPPRPKSIILAFLGVEDFESVLSTLKLAKEQLSETLSSCELIDAPSLDAVNKYLGIKSPIDEFPFYVLIETSGSDVNHDEEKLNVFLDKAMTRGIVIDGIVTNEPSKMQNIWQLRERIAEALLHTGAVYKYDVSLPVQHFYEIVPLLQNELKDTSATVVTGYGHIGDGNLHVNIAAEEYDQDLVNNVIEPFVFKWVSEKKGSISAEHGIGLKKTEFLHYSKTPEAISLMKKLKNLFDPSGILNPYKVLPLH